MFIYQHGLTGERREVTLEESDWYEKNPPWYRAKAVMAPEPYPPAKPEAKTTTKNAGAKA